jgi:hypothetical protein
MKYFLFIFLVTLVGCNKKPVTEKEKPLARVYDKYLYPSDLKGVVPSGIPASDSTSAVHDFIDKWILSELLLGKAEMNLTDEEKNVEKQMDDYRRSLLIYAYQQRYLEEKLDTLVTLTEIEQYYADNQSNFISSEPLIKGVFIKLSLKAPELYKVRQWYKTDDDESIKNLEGYCFKHASIYDHFNEGWVNLNEVLRMMPSAGNVNAGSIRYNKNVELRDNQYIYLLGVKEFVPEGTVTPFEIVKNDIHNIILNKRKVKLINELETSLYADAQNHEHFAIFK